MKYLKLKILKYKLEKNKDIISVFSSILLGVMAIFVSFKANEIATSQTNLVKKQTEIMNVEIQPAFEFEMYNVRDIESGNVFEQRVDVKNIGHYAEINEISILTFLTIRASTFENENKYFEDDVLVIDYFGNSLIENKSIGLLKTSSSKDNLEKIHVLQDVTEEKFRQVYNDGIINYDIIHMAYIRYKDSLGNKNEVFIQISPFNQLSMERDRGNEIVKLYQTQYDEARYISIETDSGMDLIEIVNNGLE